MMRILTVEETERLIGEQRWQEFFERLIEHLEACESRLPEILASFTPEERKQLCELFLRLAGSNEVIH